MSEIDYSIRTVTIDDRSRLATLLHFGSFIHQHLDWKPPLDWIGSQPYLLMEKNGSILAALACPPDLPEITWIRLFAVSSPVTLEKAWRLLWVAAKEQLSHLGGLKVAVISLQGWFTDLLESSGFDHTDNVIVLTWDGTPIKQPINNKVSIRIMVPEDLKTIQHIDHHAFGDIWKNSFEALELAFKQSSIASVALNGDEIIGYQFSTLSAMGGHLARLAVQPEMQRQGIGYLLVHHVLTHFQKLGITHVTVNTQQNNLASIALYSKAGFSLTGESYKVYQSSHNY
jgi:ribosomal protein S18 acetylase RimI-like enzyme